MKRIYSEWVEGIMKKMLLQPVSENEFLYHYTKIHGAQGILKDRSIRATKSDFLNDTNEMVYMLSVVEEVIMEIMNKAWRESLYAGIIKNSAETRRQNHYVISFSTNADSITLWAEFGDSTGYNIGFRGCEMIKMLEDSHALLTHGKVIYSQNEQKGIVRNLLTEIIPKKMGYSFEDVMEMSVKGGRCAEYEKLCKKFLKAISTYALFFKQEEFAAEEEYRVVFKSEEDDKILFREREGFLLPYLLIQLKEKNQQLPVHSVTVAPKNHVDLSKKGMEIYLESLGYDTKVELSKIKLRY